MDIVKINGQDLTNIGDAIRRKNGESMLYLPSEMPGKIDDLTMINLTDICNHGKLVGASNPYYNTSAIYNYASANPSTSKFNITNTGIERGGDGWDNVRMTFATPVDKRLFSKICCKAVIYDRTSTRYSNYSFKLGAIAKSHGHTYANFDKVVVICDTTHNYNNTSPIYVMPETTIKLDISSLSENFYYIMIQSCDVKCKFTELWLEP